MSFTSANELCLMEHEEPSCLARALSHYLLATKLRDTSAHFILPKQAEGTLAPDNCLLGQTTGRALTQTHR